jgi:hypothetical protein
MTLGASIYRSRRERIKMLSRRRIKDKKKKTAIKNKKVEAEVAEKVTPSKQELFAAEEKKEQVKKEGFKLPSKKV